MILLVPLLICTFLDSSVFAAQSIRDEYDILVFGATPAGFAASIAAARSPSKPSVLLLEPSAYVGGMASPGGIGLRDCEKDYIRTNNGTQYEWGMRNAKKYCVENPVWQPDNHLGEQTFLEMLSEYENIDLHLETTFLEGSDGVRVNNSRIEQIGVVTPSSSAVQWVRIKSFVVDASYEGEIVAASNCSFTYGRESSSKHNESLGGVTNSSINSFPYPISPFRSNDSTELLSYVSNSTCSFRRYHPLTTTHIKTQVRFTSEIQTSISWLSVTEFVSRRMILCRTKLPRTTILRILNLHGVLFDLKWMRARSSVCHGVT